MNENKLTELLKSKLETTLRAHGYEIYRNKNLVYKVIVDSNINYRPKDPGDPKRGNLAFQIDCISKKTTYHG